MPRGKRSKETNKGVVEETTPIEEEIEESSEVTEEVEESKINDILGETMIALRAKETRSKSNVSIASGFSSLFDMPEDIELPLEPFTLQYAFGTKFFKPGTIAEIIGPEHVGKTTFVFTLFGMFMRAIPDSPLLYVNTEGRNKLPNAKRISSCLSSDVNEANRLMKRITVFAGYAQKETLEEIDQWCKSVRESMTKSGIPQNTPIFVAIDTVSKLMPNSEASEMFADGKAKGLGEGSNLEFSKMMQAWTRKRAWFTEKYGIFMLLVSHQNTKINMTAMPGARPVSDANNKTKIGGHATDQTATTQFTLTRVESETNALKDVTSHIIKLNVLKNSRGIDRRSILYALRVNDLKDDGNKQEMAINFDYGLAELMALRKILGTRMITKSKFTCAALNLSQASREDFAKAVYVRPDLLDALGKELRIFGYDPNLIDLEIQENNKQIASEEVVDLDDGPSPFATPELEEGEDINSEEDL